tara:strand:- start:37 stop:459 length:423 start_codon:yes stop_codon:yes gene_type:complete
MGKEELIEALNKALGLELRAITMYAHYSAYISGIHRIHLSAHFNAESAESVTHAATVRSAIVKLGGIATTERDSTEIIHTSDYEKMLNEAYKTEQVAAKTYSTLLPIVEAHGDSELYDTLEAIYFDEQRSLEEMRMLLEK